MSSYHCPDCKETSILGFAHCTKCGKKMATLPTCNWCNQEIWPSYNFCRNCGRSRDVSLNTSPPPRFARLKKWLSGLLKKSTKE
jgi:predicted RNA-binding Zn-ribbon protein involved in translation (DUF1610 family)